MLIIIYGCGSSSESRYEEEKNTTSEKDKLNEKDKTAPQKFDMTPYHSTFNFNLYTETPEQKIWYDYDTSSLKSDKEYVDKSGYRVEVISTDNLDDANNTKSELSFRIKENIYIQFDPPFYRVRVGDFEDRNSAENQSFRLKQLGFQESRVVSDSVKVPGVQ